MITRSYQLRFLTPAFLGNAEQAAQWRTPPFKALLRQWWRVAWAAGRNFQVDLEAMQQAEGELFGSVHGNSPRQSRLRFRLKPVNRGHGWTMGSQAGVGDLSTGIETSYAWFGLIDSRTKRSDRSAIRPDGEEGQRTLTLAFPSSAEEAMEQTLALIHHFGHVGARSRGGWGAIHLESAGEPGRLNLNRLARDLTDCLDHDWAMSLGRDEQGPMLWESRQTWGTWEQAMAAVARMRKEVRSELKVDRDLRSALGFAGSGRMPSPLRWKAVLAKGGNLAIRVVAMPHQIPACTRERMNSANLQRAWRIASNALDAHLSRATIE